jgi:protein O-GlcNAc transferase
LMAEDSSGQDRFRKDPAEPAAGRADVREKKAGRSRARKKEAGRADARSEKVPKPDGPGNLARAFRKLREGRGREAAALYRAIVEPRETPVMAHVNRGVRHDEHGRHELAIGEFLAAEQLAPEDVENLSHLATAYGALSRFVEADETMHKALSLDPGSVHVRVGEAILAFRKGLYNDAEVQLKGICEGHPSHGPAHFYRGEALNRLGRFDEALQTMERAVQLQPGNWRAYHTLGVLFDRKDDRERASEMYRHARELNRL